MERTRWAVVTNQSQRRCRARACSELDSQMKTTRRLIATIESIVDTISAARGTSAGTKSSRAKIVEKEDVLKAMMTRTQLVWQTIVGCRKRKERKRELLGTDSAVRGMYVILYLAEPEGTVAGAHDPATERR